MKKILGIFLMLLLVCALPINCFAADNSLEENRLMDGVTPWAVVSTKFTGTTVETNGIHLGHDKVSYANQTFTVSYKYSAKCKFTGTIKVAKGLISGALGFDVERAYECAKTTKTPVKPVGTTVDSYAYKAWDNYDVVQKRFNGYIGKYEYQTVKVQKPVATPTILFKCS